jgi:voltage-dependent potassium channel beta subunit
MEYRQLGNAGVKVSALSLGTGITFGEQISDDVASDLMKCAYENGVNFFDNAERYAEGRSEMIMGRILREMAWPRDTFLVSSKVYWGGKLPNQEGLSRKRIFEACHAALRRIQVDYLDFYLCHRYDRNSTVEETVMAMSDLVRQGKVLYWGTSGWKAKHIREAFAVARRHHLVPPTMQQPEYNLFARKWVDRQYVGLCSRYGTGLTTYGALAAGLLTGKHQNGPQEGTRATLKDYDWLKAHIIQDTQERAGQLRELGELAKEVGLSLAVFSIAWCLKNPQVSTVLIGASRVSQLLENFQALEAQARLTPEVMKRVDRIVGVPKSIWRWFP